MKINLEMELNDAALILAAFNPDNKQMSDTIKRKGEVALERMSAEFDRIVENIDNCGEAIFN